MRSDASWPRMSRRGARNRPSRCPPWTAMPCAPMTSRRCPQACASLPKSRPAPVMAGVPIGPHQIVSSNALALAAFVTACGGVPVLVGNAPDDPDALRHIAAAARGTDLFVTTGGVSVGEHDLVRDVLSEEGLAIDFWQIAMRPGKPLMVGRYRGTPMLGLPGNPVSTLVCSLLFLKPALDRLSGLPDEAAPQAVARLGIALKQNDRRQDYLRARLQH